ncbi:tannase/feruloyl esterase family alpha/beta hydrolase [Rhizorhapis sp.]|uniref:tannase/feruloyl esterase family alpha/beta hydrolase n=1 Tax=Rhizorhapis sp. TaxID=1968842 RepID=UPI002B45C9C7|nr:tannase/feruloyl esterase family alpha/beta hydrolase [Rhizorhapis sp.]HKR17550.1 tannase/feruloyl esterase family alpha/beta hydrolase [Rhizorhapis sp.]
MKLSGSKLYKRGLLISLLIPVTTAAQAAPSSQAQDAGPNTGLECDSSIARNFRPDDQTQVLSVKQYRKGDELPYVKIRDFYPQIPAAVEADVCLVKLLVGPGNPGPADAPSTSRGIGIEIWLPSKKAWNGRIHAVGGGGWVGSEETDLTKISSATAAADLTTAAAVASREGAVSSTTDTGHTGGSGSGAFAMLPDGSINTALWQDFAYRAIHEQIVKTKALTQAYYGSGARYTYWSGGSTGGRQGLKHAQRFPEDFDGILVAYPAINWTKFITGELYPQVVIQRDLGGKYMSPGQLTMVSNAAIAACDVVGGKHLGFIIDATTCRYDPTKDKNVLCVTNGGKNGTPDCVTPTQALALNKIWYGMTADGSVPDPAVDNGFGPLTGVHRWYGLPRGTTLLALAYDPPFSIATDLVALELQDPRISIPLFRNARGNGQDGWKSLTYAQLTQAFDAGIALQKEFADINTDDPDLSAFKARGGKLIHHHNNNDELIPYPASPQYYERVIEKMGGLSEVQSFYRFYIVPGLGHSPANGTMNDKADPPTYGFVAGVFYNLLTNWVEKGVVPESVVLRSSSKSLPVCPYPQKITYVQGDAFSAESYTCR